MPEPVSSPWTGAVIEDHILPLPVRPTWIFPAQVSAESFMILTGARGPSQPVAARFFARRGRARGRDGPASAS